MHPDTLTLGEEFRDDVRRAPVRLLPAELLSALTRLDDRRSWLAVMQTLTIAGISIAVALYLWHPLAVLPAIVVIGSRQHAMLLRTAEVRRPAESWRLVYADS